MTCRRELINPVRKLALPAVGGERLGELTGEDGVDHLVLLLPDGRVYPAAGLRAHRHQASPGPRRPCGGRGRGGDGEAARGGSGAERGRHGSWLVAAGLVWWEGTTGRARDGTVVAASGSVHQVATSWVGAWRGFGVCGEHMPRRRAHHRWMHDEDTTSYILCRLSRVARLMGLLSLF